MPTLEWIGKDKVINHDKEIPFRLLKEKPELSINGDESENLIIHGDNLEALKALLPKYYGKVKMIYIDPPYNTGEEGWVYNDKVNSPQMKDWLGKVVGKEADDLCRHDKWLCMMYPRLKLLKELLIEEGVIFISIDDYENHHLKLIMNEIFGINNFISSVSRITKKGGNAGRFFAPSVDNIVIYAKNKEIAKQFREILGIDDLNRIYKEEDEEGPFYWRNFYESALDLERSINTRYFIEAPDKTKIIPPEGHRWRRVEESFLKEKNQGIIKFEKVKKSPHLDEKGEPAKWEVFYKLRPKPFVPNNFYVFEENIQNALGTIALNQLDIDFPFSKPPQLIKKIINLCIGQEQTKTRCVILDSFAGSGTTAHAVLQLNKEDGGNRKFILVEMEDYTNPITAERVRRVINGYGDVEGTGGGFKYMELGPELFDKHKQIIGDPAYDDLADYIFFTEAGTTESKAKKNKKDFYIGEKNGVHYFVIYKGRGDRKLISDNVLEESFLTIVDKYEGKKVIYADAVLLDDETLDEHKIEFKQIPYEIKAF